MSRLCPRCNDSFEDRWYCPTCGVRLVSDHVKSKSAVERKIKETEPMKRPAPSRVMATLSRLFAMKGARWQQTTWGRCIIGLLLAQGLFYALSQMVWAVMLIFGDRAAVAVWWNSLDGLLLKQALQGISVVAGGIVAGGGQRRAVRNGTIVGLYNGFLFLLVDHFLLKVTNPIFLLGGTLLQIAFGTLGGYLGRVIWRPAAPIVSVRTGLPALAEGRGEGTVALSTMGAIPLPEPRRHSPFTGQVHWVRVAIGIAIVVGGTLAAQTLFKRFEHFGLGGVQTPQQAKFITWEISVLAMIFGGAFAGANTFNGPLQGTIVGMVSSLVLILNYVQNPNHDPAQTLGLSVLGLDLNTLATQIVGTVFSVLPLSIVGGWFGGQLLPPVVAERAVSKTYTAPV